MFDVLCGGTAESVLELDCLTDQGIGTSGAQQVVEPYGGVVRSSKNQGADTPRSPGRFQNALEIGCLNGASSTAFVEAINLGVLRHATFCDVDLRETFRAVLHECRFAARTSTFCGRSVDLLRERSDFDFVFVDGDHSLETACEEVELLLRNPPTCVMAHDTSVRVAGYDHCDGPAFLKWRLQTAGPYRCLEENIRRPGEDTWRGMFLATTSDEIFEVARQSLRKWGEFDSVVEA